MKTKLFFVFLVATANSFAQFSFVHITDLHVSSVASSVNSCDLNGIKAQCYLEEFTRLNPKPAFIIASGDIGNMGNSTFPMYSALTQYLYPPSIINPAPGEYFIDSAKTIPIYFAAGNHDYYTTLYPPGSVTQTNYLTNYSHAIAPDTDYAVTTDISVIFFIRSGKDIAYWNEIDPLTPDGSGLTVAQCNWIRNELSSNSNKRKIIVMHHPIVNKAGTNCNGTPYNAQVILGAADGSLANNRTTFLNICDSNQVDVVLTGHQHQNMVANRAGNIISENCTTCGTRYVQTGTALNGCYRIITVDPSFVTVSPTLQSCVAETVNDLSNSLDISIFPNPSSGRFTLQMGSGQLSNGNYQLSIYNELGERIFQSAIRNPQSEIDISSQPNGVYFMRLQTEQGAAIKKIFINK